jgi:hypothetical protein
VQQSWGILENGAEWAYVIGISSGNGSADLINVNMGRIGQRRFVEVELTATTIACHLIKLAVLNEDDEGA